MDADTHVPSEPGTTRTLIRGIFRDAQELLDQHVRLVRSEVKQEVRQLKRGIVSVGIGVVIAGLGVVYLLGMVVQLLASSTQIPLWGCYGIVGGTLALVGAVLLFGGRKSVSDTHLAPPPVTGQALKEDVEWLKRMKHHGTAEPTT